MINRDSGNVFREGNKTDTQPITSGRVETSSMADPVSLILGLVNTGTNIANTVLDYKAQKRQYELEKDLLKYNKNLQALMIKREDTAMQRKVADYESAGISKIFAAGGQGSGAGSPIQVTAPHVPRPQVPDITPVQTALSIIKQKADISATEAQTRYLHQQALKSKSEKTLTDIKAGSEWIDYVLQKETGTANKGNVMTSAIRNIWGQIKHGRDMTQKLQHHVQNAQGEVDKIPKTKKFYYKTNRHGMRVKVYY